MPCPRHDLHTHTKYLECANDTMELAAMVQECARLGVTTLGVTDHLNSLDKLPLHRPIREDIERLDPDMDVYFGVELNFTGCDQGFPYSAAIRDELGFQYAVGGIHSPYLEEYDLDKIIETQHRHHLRVCEDPLVDVLVHPYWFSRKYFEDRGWPWFETVRAVPERLTRELGQAARDTGTAIEINGAANLAERYFGERYVREYHDYLAILAEEGPLFTTCSDGHQIGRLGEIRNAWAAADRLGLPEDRFWRPPGEPLAKAKAREGGS